MNLMHIFLVGAGGFIGSVVRYLTVVSVDRRLNTQFPYGTLTVNLVGSFVLGFLMAIFIKKTGLHEWRLFLGTGFCGGFTTFSAFTAENLNLLEQKIPGIALIYIASSVIGGLLAVWAGFALARSIF
ncbi:MAG TPA: fluoride efflux transporter CrcB [Chryseosolibacter sp.]|nr:fluoride efflux transporter CrcB [Chryseosolibacter sp.]